ncbi:MAG: nitroreductase family protein [Actinomycetota bacterium]|nr:nitroreductase family protein [Actinomycetota bacterium]
MDFRHLLRQRRMVRTFDHRPVDSGSLERVLDAAGRGPSAGFSQGLDLLVLIGLAETGRYWELAFPDRAARAGFRWPGLFAAPVLIIPLVSPAIYHARYAEPDKAGRAQRGPVEWSVPFWWVDGGMAVMLALLAAVDEGLGALFFTLERPEVVLPGFGVPGDRLALGTVALGHPASDEPGRSAARPRRSLEDIVHRGRW